MIIILEGVNGSGKSTLAKFLRERLHYSLAHAGPKPTTNEIAVKQCIHQILQPNDTVQDRATAISRQVYGDDNECVEGLGQGHIDKMNEFLRHMVASDQFLFIHTTGKGKHELKDYYTKHHIESITAKHDILRDRYNELFERVPHFEYDFNFHSTDAVVKWILSHD